MGMGAAFFMGLCSVVQADVYLPKDSAAGSIQPVKSAEDAVANVPGLNKLTRSFLIGDGFKFKLSGKELRIDHMATNSTAPVSHRNCMISLNFDSPVAFFGSSMELPIVTAQSLSNDWAPTSLGDYVLHFSKDAAVDHPTIGLKVTARF